MSEQKQSSAIRVTKDQLPLSCPPANAGVHELHPRVFLPIEKTGEATCPYCGAKYLLNTK